jgi:hypothetical protein
LPFLSPKGLKDFDGNSFKFWIFFFEEKLEFVITQNNLERIQIRKRGLLTIFKLQATLSRLESSKIVYSGG